MTLQAVDVQSFAGGFTMGAVQAGFELVGKRELPGGFGVASVEANRHLVGDRWEAQVSPWEEWEPKDVPFVFGNPPCSGFSLMSSREFRGVDSKVNSCMYAFVEYASRCRPEVMVFESVQQAYSQGAPLMRKLRDLATARTGDQWELVHVLHNAACVGGAAIRRRYFMVLTRIPFGVEPHPITRMPSVRDAIGDLCGLDNMWGPQQYKLGATWWSDPVRREDGYVDGHKWLHCPMLGRAYDLVDHRSELWPPHTPISVVAKQYYERHGKLPPSWEHMTQKMLDTDWHLGFHQLMRWDWNRAGRVITGGSGQLAMHPGELRPLTMREMARIQGFPDDWRIEPLASLPSTPMLWGKGIPVQCGRWISTWARESIEGRPGYDTGTVVADRERLIDHTHAHSHAYDRPLPVDPYRWLELPEDDLVA